MSNLTIESVETVLKETVSKCPVCRKPKPAKVIRIDEGEKSRVIMRRICPCHGTHDFTIASDSRFYWLAKGNPLNSGCGCGSKCSSAGNGQDGYLGSNALDEAKKGTIEKLSTCLALIEIVDSCNLACPTCFAESPVGASGEKLKYKSFEDLTCRIQGVLDRKGKIEILQFSGGEPTIHPEFFRLVEWVRQNPLIDYLLVNTNGVRIAKDKIFVEKLGELFGRYDDIQLYLQFDGLQEDGQMELRGTDLREIREKAIRNCEQIGLPITLAMTVNDANLKHLWDTVAYGLKFEHIRGVAFQPMFLSGRTQVKKVGQPLPQPINSADIVLGLMEQSQDFMIPEDFTPLPCGDPNCTTISWLFRKGGVYKTLTGLGINTAKAQSNMSDRLNYDIEDLRKCGCESTQLGNLMKTFELKESHAFRLLIKPFMDERTWDEDRIDRCCTHVIRPDGQLDSFCRYYYGSVAEGTCC